MSGCPSSAIRRRPLDSVPSRVDSLLKLGLLVSDVPRLYLLLALALRMVRTVSSQSMVFLSGATLVLLLLDLLLDLLKDLLLLDGLLLLLDLLLLLLHGLLNPSIRVALLHRHRLGFLKFA